MRKYHLGLVHWPGDSCALMNLSSRIFNSGYKMLLITFGNGEIIAKMRCDMILTVCVVIFGNWHSSLLFFFF